jgi:hypothetical protein
LVSSDSTVDRALDKNHSVKGLNPAATKIWDKWQGKAENLERLKNKIKILIFEVLFWSI